MLGLRLFMAPAVYTVMLRRYHDLRQHRQMGTVMAVITLMLTALAYALLPLESAAWRRWRTRAAPWFAHLYGRPWQFGDPLRYLLQGAWVMVALLLLRLDGKETAWPWLFRVFVQLAQIARRTALRVIQDVVVRLKQKFGQWQAVMQRNDGALSLTTRRWVVWGAVPVVAAGFTLIVSQPLSMSAQTVFVAFLFCLALIMRRVPGRYPVLMLIVMSLIVSGRYLWWRYTATLHWNTWQDAAFGLVLVMAETYSWLVLMLGYVQTAWPLNRRLAPLPDDTRQWPTVDVFIPTYNEDLNVVSPTVYAATGLDWPADKLCIHLLDDGDRPEFRAFAQEAGVIYRVRPDRRHAKAGNLNHSLKCSDGDLVAIFDCDHVPSRSFLIETTGEFLQDPRLALVQTPHHFFSPDPFERNLDHFGKQPNENTLFYGLIQDGNDLWNAAFFCGSCAVLRRSALEQIGGFAVETVTEDAHTALRLHRHGFRSAYLRKPLAAGLATENLAAHIGQRIRWARGMVQIFRTDNPLTGPGLTLAQRLCYLNAMLHFLAGIPRLIYLTAPLAFLLFHAYIIYAPAVAVVLYVLPHMLHAGLTNSRMQGAYRRTFWGEIYETVLSWYIARPTTVALFAPSKGAFNVTAKGGLIEEPYFDWKMATPYVVLALANVTGLGFGVWRLATGPEAEIGTVVLTMVWTLYNLVLLGGAIAVAAETRQVRRSHRVQANFPVRIELPNGPVLDGTLVDFSSGGVGVRVSEPLPLDRGATLFLWMEHDGSWQRFPAHVSACEGCRLGIGVDPETPRQKMEYLRCTFARNDVWSRSQDSFEPDMPLKSGLGVARVGISGYWRMLTHLPNLFLKLIHGPQHLLKWLWSFVPRTPLPSRARLT